MGEIAGFNPDANHVDNWRAWQLNNYYIVTHRPLKINSPRKLNL